MEQNFITGSNFTTIGQHFTTFSLTTQVLRAVNVVRLSFRTGRDYYMSPATPIKTTPFYITHDTHNCFANLLYFGQNLALYSTPTLSSVELGNDCHQPNTSTLQQWAHLSIFRLIQWNFS